MQISRSVRSNHGQTIAFLALVVTLLLGFTSLAVDLGRAWWMKRDLQGTVDAAAASGALVLPSKPSAEANAQDYLDRNPVAGGYYDANFTVEAKCRPAIDGCDPASADANSVYVTARGKAPTVFAKIFGYDHFTIGATALACRPCEVMKIDMMIVFDRTGSMNSNGKMSKARQGFKEMLELFDNHTTNVGLTILPPVPSGSTECDPSNGYNEPSEELVVPLSNDWKDGDGHLKDTSRLISAINCLQPSGGTAYAHAIEAAQAELNAHGRANARKVIIFFTDGAANRAAPTDPAGSLYFTSPCRAGVAAADAARSMGTAVYAIGYDVDSDRCKRADTFAIDTITPNQALEQIAGATDRLYLEPDPVSLVSLFRGLAHDILNGSRLIDPRDYGVEPPEDADH